MIYHDSDDTFDKATSIINGELYGQVEWGNHIVWDFTPWVEGKYQAKALAYFTFNHCQEFILKIFCGLVVSMVNHEWIVLVLVLLIYWIQYDTIEPEYRGPMHHPTCWKTQACCDNCPSDSGFDENPLENGLSA
jgi:hypothetical protein